MRMKSRTASRQHQEKRILKAKIKQDAKQVNESGYCANQTTTRSRRNMWQKKLRTITGSITGNRSKLRGCCCSWWCCCIHLPVDLAHLIASSFGRHSNIICHGLHFLSRRFKSSSIFLLCLFRWSNWRCGSSSFEFDQTEKLREMHALHQKQMLSLGKNNDERQKTTEGTVLGEFRTKRNERW